MKLGKEIKTGFMRVRCNKCKNEQNIFNTVSSKVYCLVCNEIIAEPTGGRSKVHAKVLEALS